MSHFSVIVIGPDPEEQLEPYNEHTRVEPYFRPSNDWSINFAKEKLQLIGNRDPTPEEIAEFLSEKWDDEHLVENGVVGQMSTYNPLSKWDWYVLGGRWTGYFPLKPGTSGKAGSPGLMTNPAPSGYADAALLRDIDVERARSEAVAEAREQFAKWRTCFEQFSKRPESWEQIRDRICGVGDNFDPKQVDVAREKYHDQPVIKKWEQVSGGHFWGCPVDDYGFYEEVYVDKCRNGALVPLAIVRNGEWFERGKMGWWGVMRGENLSYEDWCVKFQEMLDELPDDTLLSMYDCHI